MAALLCTEIGCAGSTKKKQANPRLFGLRALSIQGTSRERVVKKNPGLKAPKTWWAFLGKLKFFHEENRLRKFVERKGGVESGVLAGV